MESRQIQPSFKDILLCPITSGSKETPPWFLGWISFNPAPPFVTRLTFNKWVDLEPKWLRRHKFWPWHIYRGWYPWLTSYRSPIPLMLKHLETMVSRVKFHILGNLGGHFIFRWLLSTQEIPIFRIWYLLMAILVAFQHVSTMSQPNESLMIPILGPSLLNG